VGGQFDMCFDAYIQGEHFEPSTLPSPVNLREASPNELALAWQKQWQPGQELRIRFIDGDDALHERVIGHARRWLEHANLKFTFGNSPDAEIRISFLGDKYESLVGTDALRRTNRAEPTMLLGGFTAQTDDTPMRRTVLHEFGHAIGCIHEQSSPVVPIPWDEPAVYSFYRTHGWTDQETYFNVLQRYSADQAKFSAFDKDSIMQYPVPNELTIGDYEIGWNTNLSVGDIEFIRKMYPN
jgi:hypothetical protein